MSSQQVLQLLHVQLAMYHNFAVSLQFSQIENPPGQRITVVEMMMGCLVVPLQGLSLQ